MGDHDDGYVYGGRAWLDSLLAGAGKPKPCGVCGAPAASSELTETTMPGAMARVSAGVVFPVDRVIWVCRTCRRDGWL